MNRRAVGTKIPDYFREVAVREGSTAYDAFSTLVWLVLKYKFGLSIGKWLLNKGWPLNKGFIYSIILILGL